MSEKFQTFFSYTVATDNPDIIGLENYVEGPTVLTFDENDTILSPYFPPMDVDGVILWLSKNHQPSSLKFTLINDNNYNDYNVKIPEGYYPDAMKLIEIINLLIENFLCHLHLMIELIAFSLQQSIQEKVL